jgi:peptidoglycan/LPS O-acetylase OafA/YrhL
VQLTCGDIIVCSTIKPSLLRAAQYGMQPKKLDFIDSLRGLAALYVVLHHITYAIGGKVIVPRWLEPLAFLGSSGVTLFFVVSAFTLCLSMEARREGEFQPLTNYFIRRFFRIAPLFYAWVLIFSLRSLVFGGSLPEFAEITRSVFFVQNLFPGHEAGIVWASWTIGIEMLFYLLFPLAFWAMNTLSKSLAIFALSVAIQAPWYYFVMSSVADQAIAQRYWELSLLFHLSAFMAGIVVFQIYKRLDGLPFKNKHLLGLLTVGAATLGFLSLCYLSFVFPLGGESMGWMPRNVLLKVLLVTLYGCLLLGLAMRPMAFLVNRVTRFYGEISYSVYLAHVFILVLLMPTFASITGSFKYVTVAFTLAFCLAMAIITPLAWLTYRLIEKKGNAMGRALIERLELRARQKPLTNRAA